MLVLADADDPRVLDTMRRGAAWGVETVWIGAGPARPVPGAADHVIWVDTDVPLEASELFVRIYHLLWELTHVCFEHPGLLKPEPECTDEVCITCSDEGRPAEVVTVDGDEAVVRTPDGQERIDVSLIDTPAPGDLVLIHAGFAIRLDELLMPETTDFLYPFIEGDETDAESLLEDLARSATASGARAAAARPPR